MKATKPSSRQYQKDRHFAIRKTEQVTSSLRPNTRLSSRQPDIVRLELGFAPDIVKLPPLGVDQWLSEDERSIKPESPPPRRDNRTYGGRKRFLLTETNVQNLLSFDSLVEPKPSIDLSNAPWSIRSSSRPPSLNSPPLQPPPSPTPRIQLDPHPEIDFPNMSSSPPPSSVYEDVCMISAPLHSPRSALRPSTEQKMMMEPFYHCLEIPDDMLNEFQRGYRDVTMGLLEKILYNTEGKVFEAEESDMAIRDEESWAEDDEPQQVLEFSPPPSSPENVQ